MTPANPSQMLSTTVSRILFDVASMLLLGAALFAMFVGDVPSIVPVAGTQALSVAAGVLVINSASGLYKRTAHLGTASSVLRSLVAVLVALTFTYLTLSFLPDNVQSRDSIRAAAMLAVSFVVLRRGYVTGWADSGLRPSKRVLIFGSGGAAVQVAHTVAETRGQDAVIGFVPGPNEKESAEGCAPLIPLRKPLPELARELGADEIVVVLAERRSGSMPLRELLDCKLHGIRVYDAATHFERSLGQIRIDFTNASWLIFGEGFRQGAFRTAVKRAFDIVSALSLLVLTAPLMAVTAVLITMESRGPVLYRQERIGLGGRPFMVAKFRSMRTDAERDGQPRWAAADDDRVTRVGRIIRKLRIDELPQLFNVLRGEMSLVGPRPERQFFVDQLVQQIPYFAVRHSVKPGVTGWAQVRYQYGSTVEDALEKLQYDLFYVKNHSLYLDLKIMLETVVVVLTGRGAR